MKTLKTELPNWLILLVPVIYLETVYSKLPEIIPTHFHGNAVPDDYSHKTFLWTMPLLTIGIYIIMLIVPKMMSQQQFMSSSKIIYSLRLLLTVMLSALACVTIYISQPAANLQLGMYLILAFVIILIGGMILHIYFLYKKTNTVLPEEIKDSYKWGFLYYNAKDQRLFVPKRIGIGWTFNFAHPLSYLFLAILIAIIIASYVFVSRH